jgi:NAD(P)-dependent dehydrogenase (short-subunit alcohol dehydrogenase family)
MTSRLHNKNALVTGATSNIGRAIATRLAAEGAHVIVAGRNSTRGAEVVDEIRTAGGQADFVAADLTGMGPESRRLAERSLELLDGRIDVLVNNAGIYPFHSTETADEALFDQIFGVNVKATFLLTQAIVPHMIAGGGGSVVNLSSWNARRGLASSPLYAASKGAIETLTRAWAAEFGYRGIRVNAISPGVIRPLEPDDDQEFPGAELMKTSPAGRAGPPSAVAAAAVYLASNESAFIHGTVLDVDGGRASVHLARQTDPV